MVRRSSKQIATSVTTEKYRTPTYFKHPPYWRRRSRAIWITLTLLAFLWLAVSFAGRPWLPTRLEIVSESVFMNGPLLEPHTSLSKDCGTCHASRFSSVRDEDCLTCHSATIPVSDTGSAFHHPRDDRSAPRCTTCHAEHRGNIALREMDDGHCVGCHASLPEETGFRASRFAVDLKEHPESRLIRDNLPDPGKLKFNHKSHLDPKGVLAGEAEDVENTRVLGCNDCHVLDEAGEYFEPVVYEEHCGVCHAHTIQPLEGGREVPHASTTGVREFLLHHFYAHPKEEEPKSPRDRRYVDDEDDFQNSVRASVDAVEKVLYRIGNEEKCAHCHELVEGTSSAVSGLQPLPEVIPPQVPTRWMRSGSFSHKAHSNLECAKCHVDVDRSEEARDVLLPSLKTCAECHTPHRDRNNCALCHEYHPSPALFDRSSDSNAAAYPSPLPASERGKRLLARTLSAGENPP